MDAAHQTRLTLPAGVDWPERLDHGEFTAMVESLPFGERTAQKLMAVGRDERIRKREHARVLPPSWDTLYVLTRLDDDQWERGLADGLMRPGMKRGEAAALWYKSSRRYSVSLRLSRTMLASPLIKKGITKSTASGNAVDVAVVRSAKRCARLVVRNLRSCGQARFSHGWTRSRQRVSARSPFGDSVSSPFLGWIAPKPPDRRVAHCGAHRFNCRLSTFR